VRATLKKKFQFKIAQSTLQEIIFPVVISLRVYNSLSTLLAVQNQGQIQTTKMISKITKVAGRLQ